MNWQHLTAVVWLRWRLSVNQLRRAGTTGALVSAILTVLIGVGGLGLLIVGFVVGSQVLRTAPAATVMLVWDGAIAGFVLLWMAGLISELQRADAISLDRFLHLPVSPGGAFLINYLGSTVTLSTVLALPAMTGLAAGLVLSRGPHMLVLFPLVAAFFLMMTAVTYQFRGWLASMMQNKRRRRTIVAVVPMLFVLAFQLPNLWNQFGPGASQRRAERAEARSTMATLREELAAGRITREEFNRRRPPRAESSEPPDETARLVNAIAPPGWLAYGAVAATEGRAWPALAGVLGMGLIGAFSLKRAYGTTLRLYTGDFDNQQRRAASATPAVPVDRSRRTRLSTPFLETRIPWTSERVSAVAVAGLRSWTRATEFKMALLTPVIMLFVFTSRFTGASETAPEIMRPLITVSLAAFVLLVGMVSVVGNQFGYDRGAFRAFVLSPIPRRDILIGKNLSLLPFAIVTMTPVVGQSYWSNPMRLDHVLGVLVHLVTLYLVFCAAANLLSIVGPLALKPGSGRSAPQQGIRGVYPLVFTLLVTLPLGLTLLPLGIEALLLWVDWYPRFPAYLVFGIVQVAVVLALYRLAVDWEGDLLRRREQQILEIVGTRAE